MTGVALLAGRLPEFLPGFSNVISMALCLPPSGKLLHSGRFVRLQRAIHGLEQVVRLELLAAGRAAFKEIPEGPWRVIQ